MRKKKLLILPDIAVARFCYHSYMITDRIELHLVILPLRFNKNVNKLFKSYAMIVCELESPYLMQHS